MNTRTCKCCGLEKPAVKGSWVMKHGEPHGSVCHACRLEAQRERLATPEGRAKANAAYLKSSRRKVTDPATGEVISAGTLYARRLVTDPATGEVITAGALAKRKRTELGLNAEYMRNRKANDPLFKLKKNLAVKTNQVIKALAQGNGTDASCLKLFGKTRNEVFNAVAEQLAQRGWGWAEHGQTWVVDHRIPFAVATKAEELWALAKLENCQVLSVEENLAKGSSLPPDWEAELERLVALNDIGI